MNNEDYAQMQMLDYQIKQIQQVLENIDQQLVELSHTKDALMELLTLKGDEETLFPIANGIFVKGRLTDNKIVRMNIGANIVVEKSVQDAIVMMDKQYKDIDEYKHQLMKQLESSTQKLEGMQ